MAQIESDKHGSLKTLYELAARQHDNIDDFRAKLLALLPAVTGVGLFALLDGQPGRAEFFPAIGIFGALASLGLFMHELRGIQHCHMLLRVARQLEDKLAGTTAWCGPFTSRRPAALGGLVGRETAALIIYPGTIAGWIFVAAFGLSHSLGTSLLVSLVAFLAAALGGKWILTRQRRSIEGYISRAGDFGSALVTSSSTDHVRDLVAAENNKDDKAADRILSSNFIAITRGNGSEEKRDDLLRAIANPENQDIIRQIVPGEFWERTSDNLAVVRSVVTTHSRSNPGAILGRFRNIHVFERHENEWACIIWQVTKLA